MSGRTSGFGCMAWAATVCVTCVLLGISAAPALVCKERLSWDEVGLCNPNGTVDKWHCQSCPPGYGQSVECGKMHTAGTAVGCVLCKRNSTYSNTYDISQCKSCNPCQDNEVKTGQCDLDKDSTKCTCKEGYYRDTHSRGCKPCSWCCGDNTNNHVPECKNLKKRCSLQTVKSCAPATTVITTVPTTSTTQSATKQAKTEKVKNTSKSITTNSNEFESTQEDPQNPDEEQSETISMPMLGVIIAVVVLFIILFLLVAYCCRRGGNSSNHDSSPEVSSLTSNELNSSVQLIKEKDESATSDKSENKIQIFSKDTVGYVNEDKVPLVAAPGNQGKLEDPGTDTGDYATESSTMAMKCTCMNTSDLPDDTENGTGEQLSKEEKLDLPVTKLPLKVYSKICTRLDVERPFYKDYRLLAEGLGVTVDEIKALQKDPTNSLLTKCQPTVGKLIEILTKELEREDVVEIIEGWLN